MSKTDSLDPVEPGASLTYTVIVSNGGPGDASGVTLTDPLPFGVNLVSAQASQGSCAQSAGFVACNLGSVESGASAGVQINVTIDPSIQVETLFNSVFVDSDQEDSNGDNNFDQEETTVLVSSEPLTIFTTSLPDGIVNNPYFASLAATGGAPPYTWSILNGSLPPGLSGDPSGFISGTPSSSDPSLST